jgi:hypothetical protein
MRKRLRASGTSGLWPSTPQTWSLKPTACDEGPWPPKPGARSLEPEAYNVAITSISTFASLGSLETCTVARAGAGAEK